MTTVKVGEKKISFPDGMRPEEIQDVIATYVNAAVDVGATITSGAVAEPVAGLTALATGDPDAVEGMTSRMTYQPRTEMGKRALNAIGTTMQSAVNAVGLEHMPGYWRDRVVPALQDSAGPIAGSALAAGSLAALAGLMNMGGGGRTRGFGRYQSGQIGSFDDRFDKRVGEKELLEKMEPIVRERSVEIPEVDITELVGQPFVTTMSDRTRAGGELLGINDTEFDSPVNLQGGQGYMFENPGQVWASGKKPAGDILREAVKLKESTGQDPLFMPWRMAPTGGDFATMTGETMLKYASAAMGKGAKRSLNARLKKMIPGWQGVDSPESIEQFRAAPDKVRKQIKQMMDVEFRNKGGLSVGGARLAVADPQQINATDQGIMNVGRIDADQQLISGSGHAAYSHAVPGGGVGQLTNVKDDATIFDLVPEVRSKQNPRRAMEMKPYSGVLTEELIAQVAKKYGISLPAATVLLSQGQDDDQSI